jgi:molecular chaperone DnaK (HSP70)
MPLAIDFGTSNTVAALWDADTQDARSLPLADLTVARTDPHGREFHVVPSLMHFHERGQWTGQQVVTRDLLAAPGTFRWMKTYTGSGMKLPRTLFGKPIDNFDAAAAFLTQVINAVGIHADLSEEEVAFTLPVEAFEHAQRWLDGVVRSAGVLRPRYLDEASAAALGYSARVRPGAPYLVFDFGGGTLDVSIVRSDETTDGTVRSRLLGKAGTQVGGSALDQWLAKSTADAALAGRDATSVRTLMPRMLAEAERVKEALSAADAADFEITDPQGALLASHRWTRSALEDLMEGHGLFDKVGAVLDAAEGQARAHGYDRTALQAVLLTGGSSLIPSVRRLVRSRYGELTRADRPFDAVAAGAAAFVAGAGFDDRIRHSYALRPYDRVSGQYVYHTIVPAGTPYPCTVMTPSDATKPLTLTIKASQENQTRCGLQVYEVADRTALATGTVDLVFDQNGAARYTARADEHDLTHRPIGSSTGIPCDPPAQPGEARFLATFIIDASKHLCATIQDTRTGRFLFRDRPLVKLT